MGGRELGPHRDALPALDRGGDPRHPDHHWSLGPFAAYFIAKRICIGLQKKDREIALHGYESGRIVRLPGGEYVEVHEQLSDYERWKLVSFDDYKPLMIRPNKRGRITVTQRVRAVLSRWFYEDRIAPVSKSEIEAAHGAPLIDSTSRERRR